MAQFDIFVTIQRNFLIKKAIRQNLHENIQAHLKLIGDTERVLTRIALNLEKSV